jgi:hypothetical protein
MKKIALLVSILALAMCASAQTLIDFTSLTATATPTAIPEGYAGLNWTGLDFVDPLQWSWTNGTQEVGAGFTTGPEALVAFGGGPLCYPKHGGHTAKSICSASIAAGVGPNALSQFSPAYVYVSEGWADDGEQTLLVKAYNNGTLIGSQTYDLQTQAQKFQLVFPVWGPITELKFYPSPGGSFVLYVLGLN